MLTFSANSCKKTNNSNPHEWRGLHGLQLKGNWSSHLNRSPTQPDEAPQIKSAAHDNARNLECIKCRNTNSSYRPADLKPAKTNVCITNISAADRSTSSRRGTWSEMANKPDFSILRRLTVAAARTVIAHDSSFTHSLHVEWSSFHP